MLTPAEFEKKQALLADPSKQLSPEVRAKVKAAVDEFRTQFMNQGAYADQGGSLSDIQSVGAVKGAPAPSQDALAQSVLQRLDPTMPIVPQVLSLSPATTHPEGDDQAQAEWLQGDLSNPNVVTVYEAPAKVVREKLLANPEIYKAMRMDVPATPEAVMAIQAGDSTVQAYNDYMWRQTADAAAKAGKAAYRYSKAPWMASGKNAGLLDTLKTKTVAAAAPFGDSVSAFVMGVDDTAAFGAVRAGQEAVNPEVAPPKFGQETAGGIPDGDARTRNATVQEEHPTLYALGQGVGVLAPWGVANKVFGATIGGATKVAEAAGAGALGRAAAGVVGAAAGGAAVQAGQEGVDAASGKPTTLGEASERIKDAGLIGGALGAAGELAVGGARGVGKWVREGEYFEGLPGRVERQGVTPKVGRGYVDPPTVKAAKTEALARGIKPIDTFAEKLDEPLTATAKAHVEGTNKRVGDKTHEVASSPEGRALIPARNTVDAAHAQFRERTASIKGRAPTAVGIPNAERTAKSVFNQNIEGVSVTPREGWVPVPVSEAESLLNPGWQRRTVKAADAPAGRTMHARSRADLARTDELGADVTSRRKPPETGIERSADDAGALDQRGYRIKRPERLPSGEERGLAVAKPGDRSYPRLDADDTRYHRDEQRGIERVSPGGPLAKRPSSPGGPVVDQRPRPAPAPKPGIPDAEFTEKGPASIPDAEFTERRGKPAAARNARPASAPRGPAPRPGSFSQELRKRGIKTVYVAPRQYDLIRQESVIKRLRTPGADNAKNRDMKKLAIGALEDRDQRTWQGEQGGWSKLQRGHEKDIRAAKDTQERAAPKEGGAYEKVIKLSRQREGQSRDQRAIEDTAARAGGNALEMLRGSRVMHPLQKLKARSAFGKDSRGQRRGWFGVPVPQVGDAAMLRGIYPATRALEPLAGAHLGRAGGLKRIPEARQEAKAERREHDQANAEGYADRAKAAKPKKSESSAKKSHRRRIRMKDDQ